MSRAGYTGAVHLMDGSQPSLSPSEPEKPAGVTLANMGEVLFNAAAEALVLAFLIQIVGNILLGWVGGVWREMTPSPPPLFGEEAELEFKRSSSLHISILRRHQFGLLFGVVFICKAVEGLIALSRNPQRPKAVAFVEKLYSRVSEQWFRLVIGNAFTAFLAVLVIEFTQRFSPTHWLWQMAAELLRPTFQSLQNLWPQSGFSHLLGRWVSWYNTNQLKFTFWLLYSAAICDDLGIPNYKTLGRLIWRRCFGHKTLPDSATPDNKPRLSE